MKNSVLVWIVGVLTSTFFLGKAQAEVVRTPVSVQSFVDKTGNSNCRYDWDWWRHNLGDAFADMLVDELARKSNFDVLERAHIRDIYENEVDLINSENSETKIQKGNFQKAKYTIVGTVTEFEYCAADRKTGMSVGKIAAVVFGKDVPDIDMGFSGAKTHVVVNLRIIETQTGKVVSSVRGESRQSDSRFQLNSDLVTFDDQKTSPMGKTAQVAIADAVRKIKL